jgi:L-tyrosine isonitrile synthase
MPDCVALSAGEPASLSICPDQNDAAVNCGRHDPAQDTREAATVPGRRSGRRSALPPASKVSAEKVLQSFNTWAFKREQPCDPQRMLQVISESMSLAEPVSFVLYWGKGPRSQLAEPDLQCLDFLAALAGRVCAVYAPGATIKLIFTDTHAQLNGHTPERIGAYFAEVEAAAAQRGFGCCRLSEIMRAANASAAADPDEDVVPEDTLLRLSAGARKWYRGNGTVEQGALHYYRMNMVEKRAVELAFPRSIFVTFSGSELRSLFPKRLPIFFMYSIKRGVSSKPWFLASDAIAPDLSFCPSS